MEALRQFVKCIEASFLKLTILKLQFRCRGGRTPPTLPLNLAAPAQSQHDLKPGLGKIDCNRYSIAIFFSFCLSNALEPLLF